MNPGRKASAPFSPDLEAPPPRGKKARIYLVGDSISLHYGPWLEKYLAGIALYSRWRGRENEPDSLDVARGGNSGDSSRVLSIMRFLSNEPGFGPDLLLFNCGLHDIKRNPGTGKIRVSLDEYRKNLSEITREASRKAAGIAWIRTTPLDDKTHNRPGMAFHRFKADLDRYNAAADRIMAEKNIPSIDLETFTLNLGVDLFCDHVHFQEAVRRLQAAFIAGWIQEWNNPGLRKRKKGSQ